METSLRIQVTVISCLYKCTYMYTCVDKTLCTIGPLILIMGGTGFIAQHAISSLVEFGLKSRILIYCRGVYEVYFCSVSRSILTSKSTYLGDITAGQWRKKGFSAHHILAKLLIVEDKVTGCTSDMHTFIHMSGNECTHLRVSP